MLPVQFTPVLLGAIFMYVLDKTKFNFIQNFESPSN